MEIKLSRKMHDQMMKNTPSLLQEMFNTAKSYRWTLDGVVFEGSHLVVVDWSIAHSCYVPDFLFTISRAITQNWDGSGYTIVIDKNLERQEMARYKKIAEECAKPMPAGC